MIKKLCLLLSFILAFSMLGACSSKKNEDKKSAEIVSSEQNEQTDDTSDDEQSEDDFFEEESEEEEFEEDGFDDYYDEEYEDFFGDDYFEEIAYVNRLKVYNDEAPIVDSYAGMSGTVYHAFGFMKDDKTDRVYTDKMLDIELDRLENTGMRYCRTRYTSEWAWDPKTETYDFTTDRFGYFCDYAKALQKRDMNIILSVGWHFGFVSHITSHSIDEVGYLNGEGADKYGESAGFKFADGMSSEDIRIAKAARRFGYFYAQTLRELRARGINNVSHLLYMTEPSNGYLGAEAGAENHAYLLFSQNFKKKLVEEKIAHTVKHMGPNEVIKDANDNNSLFKYVLERDPDLFDVYAVHNYPHMTDVTVDVLENIYGEQLNSFVDVAKKTGVYGKKEFWIDEYDVNYDGKEGAQNVSWAGLQNVFGLIMAQQRGIENTVFWQLFDQLWTDHTNTGGEFYEGIHMCGDIPSLFMSATPYDQYYVIGLFCRYNGNKNGKSYRTSYFEDAEMYEGVYCGAVQLEDGSWTVSVVNFNVDETYIEIDFAKPINQTLYRHLCTTGDIKPTPDARLADADKCFKDVKTKLYDTIPGGSIVIYTGLKG